jgi:hypothetical protein
VHAKGLPFDEQSYIETSSQTSNATPRTVHQVKPHQITQSSCKNGVDGGEPLYPGDLRGRRRGPEEEGRRPRLVPHGVPRRLRGEVERALDAAGDLRQGVGEHQEGGGDVRGRAGLRGVRGGVGRGGGAQRGGEPRPGQAQGEQRPARELLQGEPRDRRVPHLRQLEQARIDLCISDQRCRRAVRRSAHTGCSASTYITDSPPYPLHAMHCRDMERLKRLRCYMGLSLSERHSISDPYSANTRIRILY